MILVIVGTQTMGFLRLLNEIQRLVDNGFISTEVVIQSGFTKFKSKNIQIFDFLPAKELKELQTKADLIITHGGVGTILEGLAMEKKIIAVPRLKKFKEHINDHQLEIVENFTSLGYILSVDDINELASSITKGYSFVPNKFVSNRNNFVAYLKCLIDNL
ncbi:PssE/Cps14G family polysaccharide biosynthesis glycosyltransferase [Bacteroides sp.]